MLALLPLLILVRMPATHAQSLTSSRSAAMGGAGISFLRGVESLPYNPANIHLNDTTTPGQILAGAAGGQFNPLKASSTIPGQWRHFQEYFTIFNDKLPRLFTGNTIMETNALDRLYTKQETVSRHSARYEVQPLAISWSFEDFTVSLAVRSKSANSFKIGKGWYVNNPIEKENGQFVIDRSLHQKIQTINEIQFGYAQPLTYLNGLTPSLGRFYAGIAPSILIGGPFMNAQYDVKYVSSNGEDYSRYQTFSQSSSGAYSKLTKSIRQGSSSMSAINRHLSYNSLNRSTGYGLGVDVGITYIYPLSSNLDFGSNGPQLISQDQNVIQIGVALNDIGYFKHRDNPATYHLPSDTVFNIGKNQSTTTYQTFTGSPGQFNHFIQQYGELSNPYQSAAHETSSFKQLFPGSVTGSISMSTKRLTIAAEAHASLGEQMFGASSFGFRSGIEYYLFDWWALRSGFNFRTEYPSLVTAGAGFNFGRWSVDTAVQLADPSLGLDWNIHGMSLTTVSVDL